MNDEDYLTKSILIKLSNYTHASLVRSHILEILSRQMAGHQCYVEMFDTSNDEDYDYEMFIRIPKRYYNKIVLINPSYFFGDAIEDTNLHIPPQCNGTISHHSYNLSFKVEWNNS